MAWRSWLPNEAPRPWRAALAGAGLGVVATLARLALAGPLGATLPFITYFPALILAAAMGGLAGGVACLLVSLTAVVVLVTPLQGDSGVASVAWTYVSFVIAGGLVIAVAAALSDSVRQLRRSQDRLAETERRLQTLVGELVHRNRNALFVIMSIVSQSARGAQTPAEAEQMINARLQALVRAQEVILAADGARADLTRLLELALEPFDLSRFDIAPGNDVQLDSDVALSVGLLLHELATNAVKHGALSSRRGRVGLGWSDGDAGFTRLSWTETGGPPVTAPTRAGFGSRLFSVALTPRGGGVERRFEPGGLICVLTLPVGDGGRPGLLGSAYADRFADPAAPDDLPMRRAQRGDESKALSPAPQLD